jgi:hypothetical protein
MTVLERAATTPEPPVDPFTIPRSAPARNRPRLLSYVGRWGRARRWLPDDALPVTFASMRSGGLRQKRLTRALLPLHVVYPLDDLPPLGRSSHQLSVRAGLASPGLSRWQGTRRSQVTPY